jgi:SSS family solute:Na+ symporter
MRWLDYVVVLGYLAFVFSLGISFSRKQKSTDRYFAGGRSIPTWAVGMSILATLISSVTFLAYPGEGYSSNWIRLVQGLMVPVVLIFLVWFIVPIYRHVIGLSAYEYFEKRFGFFARLYCSLAFVLAHFSKMGTVFFLLALALSKMMGINTYYVILVLGILVIIYTLLGGIEAVIWCDVIQGFMLMAGGLICVAVLLLVPAEGPAAALSKAWNSGKMGMGPYNFDFKKLTFIVMALNGIFYSIQKYGTDQTIVQRYLTAKSDKAAIKAALMGVFLCVPVWALFMFIGTCLWSFYVTSEHILPAGTRVDAIFPYFIMTELPMGVTGLILAALIAAALSSLDSDLNCLGAIGVEDYFRRFKTDSTDKQRLLVGRFIVAVSGICSMVVAFWYVQSEGKNVLAIVFALYAIFSGGIAGIFVLAFFTTRTNKRGLYVGIVACVLFTAWALLTSNPIIGDKKVMDLGRYNFTHHKYMLGVYSHIVLFVVGYICSFFFSGEKDTRELTFYGWLEKRKKSAEVK